jgi:hypothetical protein
MGIAITKFRWTPQEFWQSTPHEFFSAIEVLREQAKALES